MTTNNPSFEQPCQTPGIPSAPMPGEIDKIKEKREYSFAERLLLPTSLVIAILCDRLIFAPVARESVYVTRFSGVFWLCYLVIFYAFYWKKLRHDRVMWYVAGCCAVLCSWSFFFAGQEINFEYNILTYLVIPAVLMAHAQFTAGNYKLKDAGEIALAWLLGWIIKPFSGIPSFLGALGSTVSGGNRATAKKAALGAAIVLPLFCVIIPLLCGADRVFGYYLGRLTGNWNLGSLVGHTVIVVFAFALFYSFLWNIGFGAKQKIALKTEMLIDKLICCIILGSVAALYILFCAVQFTYLFAGAGLPDGMTYSEYAREGFAQTVAVCAINLLIFGIFIRYGEKKKAVAGLLAGLLGLTGVMLASGLLRLGLYIDAYGLTWLRLLSAWFIIYLAAAVILCAIRMLREKLPAVALCALLLLGWYTILGYSNPDALIASYNQSHNYDISETR